MLKCKNSLQEDLKAYLDGELPASYRFAVEKHLESCSDCQSELESLRRLSTQLTEVLPAAAPLPDALRARILAALPEKTTPRPFSLAFWRRPGPMATLGGALAMGCALVLWLRVPEQEKSVSQDQAKTLSLDRNSAPTAATGAAGSFSAGVSSPVARNNSPTQEPASSKTWTREVDRVPLTANKTASTYERVQLSSAAKGAAAPSKRTVPSLAMPSPTASISVAKKSTERISTDAFKYRTTTALSPTLGEGEPNKEKKNDSDARVEQAPAMKRAVPGAIRALTAVPVPPPMSYTLTIAAGKRAEVEETIRKLAEELTTPVLSAKPEFQLGLALEQREQLLERLKTLGKLTETAPPPTLDAKDAKDAPTTRLGGGGFGGGFGASGSADRSMRGATGGGGMGGGGGRGRSAPTLRFTLVIKEAERKEEQ